VFESYLVRQPIFNINKNVIGYELFFNDSNLPISHADEQSTSTSIFNDFIENKLSFLVDNNQVFIRISREIITNHNGLVKPLIKIALVLPDDLNIDNEIITGIESLIKKGYQIALNNNKTTDIQKEIIRLSHFVKVDINQYKVGELSLLIANLKGYPTKLIAVGVETLSQYKHCQILGFDSFQGQYINQPEISHGKQLPANQVYVMQLLGELHNTNTESKDLENIIKNDVGLSFKLLSYINSAAFSLKNEIESIRHAITIMGISEIKKWASIIALSNIKNKPVELIRIALIRAKMCEQLTQISGNNNPGSAFLVGLFSTLDLLMDAPLKLLLDMLPLSKDITDSLLFRTGPYSNVLNCVYFYENRNWTEIENTGFSETDIISSYQQSTAWSNESSRQLHSKAA